jgi:hypothetical protein
MSLIMLNINNWQAMEMEAGALVGEEAAAMAEDGTMAPVMMMIMMAGNQGQGLP